HALEGREGEVDLATHLNERRRLVRVKTKRDIADRAKVGCYVLADASVPSCSTLRQHAIAIREAHGGAVNLQLRYVARLFELLRTHDPQQASFPLAKLVVVERVPERKHGNQVA